MDDLPSYDQLPAIAQTPPEEVRERVAAALSQQQPETPPPVEAGDGVPADGNGRPAALPNGGRPQPADAQSGPNGSDANGSHDGARKSTVKIASKPRDMHCDVCGRVVLRGEPVVAYLAPPTDRRRRKRMELETPGALDPHLTDFRKLGKTDRKLACELCWIYAEEHGWSPLPGPGVPR